LVKEKEVAIDDLKTSLAEKEEMIVNLNNAAARKEAHVSHLEGVIGEKKAELDALKISLRVNEAALNSIYSSRGWKALSLYYRAKNKFSPINGKRRNAVKFLRFFFGKIGLKPTGLLTRENINRSICHIKNYGIVEFGKKVWSKLTSEKTPLPRKVTVPILNLPVIKEAEGAIVPYEDASISIVIPTKNGGCDFGRLLSLLKKQKGLKKSEIIIVDSGSSDKTVETAKAYGARVIEVPPEKFSHSVSRNIGAENSSGKYIFFTVQDALPPSDLFLHELFNVLKHNDVAAVSCENFHQENIELFGSKPGLDHYKFLDRKKMD
jgi:hypothetical protein